MAHTTGGNKKIKKKRAFLLNEVLINFSIPHAQRIFQTMECENIMQHIKRYQETKSAEELTVIYHQYRKLIRSIAKSYLRDGEIEELEDLEQEGVIALIKALETYEESKGVLFHTWLGSRLRWHYSRYMATHHRISMSVREHEMVCKYSAIVEEWEKQSPLEIPDSYLCSRLCITQRQLDGIKSAYSLQMVESLDAAIDIDNDGNGAISFLASPNDGIGDAIEAEYNNGLKALLDGILDTLPDINKRAVKLVYYDGLSQVDAQKAENLKSRQTFNARLQNGLNRIKTDENMQAISDYLDDEIYNLGVSRTGAGYFNRTWTSSTEHAALKLIEG